MRYKASVGPIVVGLALVGQIGSADARVPDDKYHQIAERNLTAKGAMGSESGRWQLLRINTYTFRYPEDGDVFVYDDNHGDTGWAGQTSCVREVDSWDPFNTDCDIMDVKYNERYLTSDALWKSVGCHEYGHTVNIDHRVQDDDPDNNSCMRSAIDANRTAFDDWDIEKANRPLH